MTQRRMALRHRVRRHIPTICGLTGWWHTPPAMPSANPPPVNRSGPLYGLVRKEIADLSSAAETLLSVNAEQEQLTDDERALLIYYLELIATKFFGKRL